MVDTAYKKSLIDKKPYEVVHRLLFQDSRVKYVKEVCETIFDEDGKPVVSLGSVQDISKEKIIENELIKQKTKLDYQANHDVLTGLPNRALFMDRLKHALQKAKRNGSVFALLFIDLDHFKEINDSLGHAVGDEVLVEVTQRLNEIIRSEDTVSRLGGDEFTIILEDLSQAQDASLVANKIVKSLSESMTFKEQLLYISSSIGISTYPDDGVSAEDLLKYADAAMYKAKDKGRNNFQYYSSDLNR
ncbi:GGDEF domain-containing protein [Sulfurimonas sp. SAG-AH-194-L11]|nr:GGDEF domain-containing protein [Sulfurimonas sp. SAG-AH-194-L11]